MGGKGDRISVHKGAGKIVWPRMALPPAITRDEVHVWVWDFGGGELQGSDIKQLDAEERSRCERFRFPRDRVRFSVCHANMRRILAGYLKVAPQIVRYETRANGKPELSQEMTSDLKLNLSHSEKLGVLAVALGIEVGVDVEDIRPIEPAVADSHFSPREVKDLGNLYGNAWLEGFYRCWTRKEAILKAEGAGLRIPLGSFDVSLLPGRPADLLDSRPEAKLTRRWRLEHLAPADGVVGALAVGASNLKVVCGRYD